MKRVVFLFSFLGLVLTSCQPETHHAPVNADSVHETAAPAVRALASKLMAALSAALTQGGAEEAVRICSIEAEVIAANLPATIPNVNRVTRRSDRPRNPANQADDSDLQAMNIFSASDAPEFVVLQDESSDELLYFEPIRVASMCLACHGDPAALKPTVRKIIQQTYPDDQATGYSSGDLRGVFRVTVKAQ